MGLLNIIFLKLLCLSLSDAPTNNLTAHINGAIFKLLELNSNFYHKMCDMQLNSMFGTK